MVCVSATRRLEEVIGGRGCGEVVSLKNFPLTPTLSPSKRGERGQRLAVIHLRNRRNPRTRTVDSPATFDGSLDLRNRRNPRIRIVPTRSCRPVKIR